MDYTTKTSASTHTHYSLLSFKSRASSGLLTPVVTDTAVFFSTVRPTQSYTAVFFNTDRPTRTCTAVFFNTDRTTQTYTAVFFNTDRSIQTYSQTYLRPKSVQFNVALRPQRP